MPKDVKKYYRFLYSKAGYEIFDLILSCIDLKQYQEICDAVKAKIEFSKQLILAGERAELLKISSQLTAMSEYFSKKLEGVDLNKFAKKLSEAENLDEEKLAGILLSEKSNNTGQTAENEPETI